jgi:hypothetical protein
VTFLFGQLFHGNDELAVMHAGSGHAGCQRKTDIGDVKMKLVAFLGNIMPFAVFLAALGAGGVDLRQRLFGRLNELFFKDGRSFRRSGVCFFGPSALFPGCFCGFCGLFPRFFTNCYGCGVPVYMIHYAALMGVDNQRFKRLVEYFIFQSNTRSRVRKTTCSELYCSRKADGCLAPLLAFASSLLSCQCENAASPFRSGNTAGMNTESFLSAHTVG